MQRYLSEQAIDFSVPLVNGLGEAVAATKVNWQLFDEKETVVASGEVTPSDGDTESAISIDSTNCTITNGESTEVRALSVTVVWAEGSFTNTEYFVLEKSQTVIPGINSFVTYLESLRLMPEFPQFTAFNYMDEQSRKSALIAAYRNIGLIEFSEDSLVDADNCKLLDSDGQPITCTLDLSPDLFSTLHPTIKRNLMLAQMVEAEFVLGGDGVEKLRTQGVMSYSVGEVKQFFRTAKPLELAVSKHALRYIGGYVQYNRRLTRV